METLKFKSNINCDGCIAKVTETLDKAVGHKNWSVDIKNPDKVLTLIEEIPTNSLIFKPKKCLTGKNGR